MKPYRYLTPRCTAKRQLCLAWIMARRPKVTKLWLAKLQDTPQAVARSWANGDIAEYAAVLVIITVPSFAIGAAFALAIV